MTGLDEERLVRGSRDWKISVSFGFILFFLFMSSFFFAIMVATAISEGYSEIHKYTEAIALLGIVTAIISIPMLLLVRYYRHLYYHSVFEESSTGAYHKPTPTKCSICGRHPVSKMYHLRKIHGINEGTIGEYYVNCGCKHCVKPIHMQGYG